MEYLREGKEPPPDDAVEGCTLKILAKLFTSDEILSILVHYENKPQLRARVLLGINCGFANFDLPPCSG